MFFSFLFCNRTSYIGDSFQVGRGGGVHPLHPPLDLPLYMHYLLSN